MLGERSIFPRPGLLPRLSSLWPAVSLAVVLTLASMGDRTAVAAEAEAVDYRRDIRPILAAHCLKCHGFDEVARRAGLRLDTRDGLTARIESGSVAVMPGRADDSELVRRVASDDPDERMPPPDAGPALAEQEIRRVKQWIDEGALWSEHWAFVPPTRPAVPSARDSSWSDGPLDAFVHDRQLAAGIQPSPEAGRRTLLRRLSLDLLGLPPDPHEVVDFLADDHPNAYGRLVDRLLANPHYGERIGRLWLDAARYADSSGYANDVVRSIWPYRDWVIAALNADMPFDQFTIEQLAGDLLPQPTRDQRVATGFHRNTPHQYEGGSDPEQYRVERIKNRVDTTGTVWLGLTVGCAQCHSHKYDPISQTEYYQLYAFFNSADEPDMRLPDESQQQKLDAWDTQIAQAVASDVMKLQEAREAFVKTLPVTLAVGEAAPPRETRIQVRGNFLDPGQPVEPGTIQVLHPWTPPAERRAQRLDLVQWLVQPDNPLTARVTVNRIWQHLFAAGIVETENDFGQQGSLPSHPALLDWLAVNWIDDDGWSFKRLIRRMVLSATYRQSSHHRDDLDAADPLNRLVARQSRHRVETEIIRDLALEASDLFSRRIGGPSVFPPVSPGVIGGSSAAHKWPTSEGADRYRRGIYTAVYRSDIYPMLAAFDGPDRDNACTRRNRSNTPLQSLMMANDPAMVELARGLGSRILRDSLASDASRIATAFEVCFSRQPTEAESARLATYVRQQRQSFGGDEAAAREWVGETPSKDVDLIDAAVWTAVARVLLNLDEFITRQ